jgi:hypothetical protein
MSLPASEKKLVTLPPLKQAPSPNQSARIHGNDAVDLIIVHSPEGPYAGMVKYLQNPNSGVSYHILVKEDGSEATQLVPYGRKAWHAGVQNSRSEGISLCDYARNIRAFSPGGRKLARIVAFRLYKRGLKPVWRRKGEVGGGFCRHADIQADRSDPMNLSRWLAFVAMVKFQYYLGGFRKTWGRD